MPLAGFRYNGYGLSTDDLHFAPDALYREISPFADPFGFIAESAAFRQLEEGYSSDISRARQLPAEIEGHGIRLIMLPDAAWTRRVSGVFGNELARAASACAHALVTELPDGNYRVSVRAPLANKNGADVLCMQFPTGGGRKAAAGVNALPADLLDNFITAFRQQYGE